MAPRGRPPRMSRAQQERELLAAARRVLDERGVDAAPMEAIARTAGISKALLYRHVSSKDELQIRTVVVYLDELGELLEAIAPGDDPVRDLLEVASAFLRYGIDHPAFLDCSLALLRRSPEELYEEVSAGTLLRVTQAMARSLAVIIDLLRRGSASRVFWVEDPELWANYWYARALGSLHLARMGVIVSPGADEVPRLRPLAVQELERVALEDMLADLGIDDPRATVASWAGARTTAATVEPRVADPS